MSKKEHIITVKSDPSLVAFFKAFDTWATAAVLRPNNALPQMLAMLRARDAVDIPLPSVFRPLDDDAQRALGAEDDGQGELL